MDSLFFRKDRMPIDVRALLRRALKNRRAVLAAVLGALILSIVLFGSRGVVQRLRFLEEKAALEERVRLAEAEQRQLRAELKALDGDRKAIEKVAREKHLMIREGETLYKVRPGKK